MIGKLQDNKTSITFRTSCAIQFILDVPIANTSNTPKQSFLKFVPQVGKRYKPHELVKEMNAAAQAAEFPLKVSYVEGKIILSCLDNNPQQKIRVTDREFKDTDGAPDPPGTVYQGAQYGEARRFLNHLFISTDFEISYLPYSIPGSYFSFVKEGEQGGPLTSERSLLYNHIGMGPIPIPPQSCSAQINANYEFTIEFDAPLPVGSRTGVYLMQVPGNLENWDIVPLELDEGQVTSYTFTNLGEGQVFRAAISVIGFYDESTLFYQTDEDVTVTGSSPTSFPIIFNGQTRGERNNIVGGQALFDYSLATTNLPPLPNDLTKRSQIISVSIKFYININSVNSIPGDNIFYPPSYPSDARLDIENGGTTYGDSVEGYSLFDYMYWKKVTPSNLASVENSDVFGSTGFPGTNFGGLPLNWQTSVLTSENVLNQIFPSTGDTLDSRKVPNLRFFIGYASNQLYSDQNISPIYEYSIEYNTI